MLSIPLPNTFMIFLILLFVHFEQMVDRMYHAELQLNKANSSGTEASFFGFEFIHNKWYSSTKIYDKRNYFAFDIVNFPFHDGDVPRRTSYGVYISQLIRFTRASALVNDVTCRKNINRKNSLNRTILVINFVRHFQSFIADTEGCWKNIM